MFFYIQGGLFGISEPSTTYVNWQKNTIGKTDAPLQQVQDSTQVKGSSRYPPWNSHFYISWTWAKNTPRQKIEEISPHRLFQHPDVQGRKWLLRAPGLTHIMWGKVTSPIGTGSKGKSHISLKKSHQEHLNPMARRDSATHPISRKSSRSIAHTETFHHLDDNFSTLPTGTALSILPSFS